MRGKDSVTVSNLFEVLYKYMYIVSMGLSIVPRRMY